MNNPSRRPLAGISFLGISLLRRQSPWMTAWWSAAFPGFGHCLLNQKSRAILLTLTEVIINRLAHINEAIVYSFCGQFEAVKSVLSPQWALGYIILYLFAIGDSYRSAVVQNKMCRLAELENQPLRPALLHPLEFQYMELKSPWLAAFYSFFSPGLGQLYNHQILFAFWATLWWWVYLALSHTHEALVYLFLGRLQASTSLLHPRWYMFMPSVLGGSVYYAFITVIEHNRLFCLEQRRHLIERYRNSQICIFP